MWNIFFVFLLCLPASVPVRRDRSIDSWFRGLKRNMKKRSLNLPDVPAIVMNRLPSKRESFDSMVDGVMSDSIPLRAMPIRPVTRKEYRCLKHDERSKLHEALQKTKQTMEGPLSQYDYFVSQHEDSRAPGAHFGPAFGPWHRHYLYQFEQVLRSHCSDCAIPFWDSRLESRLGGNPQHSILFSPQLAGNAVGAVTSGFAANWVAPGACKDIHGTLYRNVVDHSRYLYEDQDVRMAASATTHEAISMDWDETFELNHGYVHASFGRNSHMGDLLCSPVDPLFLMHHCFVDNLFERVRQNIKKNNPPLKWADLSNLPPGSDASIAINHAPDAEMAPFNVLNREGLMRNYQEAFTYQTSPADVTVCSRDSHCCQNGYSRFLWCHTSTGRCLAKVKEGSSLDASFPAKACFCSGSFRRPVIQSGRCACRLRSFNWLKKFSNVSSVDNQAPSANNSRGGGELEELGAMELKNETERDFDDAFKQEATFFKQETVPLSTQETVPLSTQETVLLSTQETVLLSTQETVLPSTQETVFPSTQKTVLPSTQETVPPSTPETVPSSKQETAPSSTQETVLPSSTQETVPPFTQETVSSSTQETVLPSTQETVFPSTQKTVPPSTQETVPPPTPETVPLSKQETAPSSTQETVLPSSTQETVPPSRQETVPSSTQETVLPSSTQETVPPSTQETVPSSTQETVPPSTQKTAPSSTQETVPPSTQETVPPSTQETVPPSTQETVSSSKQEAVSF